MPNNQIPFSAAIFDLDGTLLDSNGVWRDVDARFFAELGLAEPDDYARAVQGMSFREGAAYTARRFGLEQGVDAIMDTWLHMAREAYAEHVEMKPGARAYLRLLKRAGVKLAVATANRAELYEPALARAGVLDLFDAICTSADAGDTNKADGALFRLAARRLGVAPGDCVVFEDVPDGLIGAKAAGMCACAVRDAAVADRGEEVEALADWTIDDFTDMTRVHAMDAPPGRCVIFTARCDGDPARVYAPRAGDYVLCADRGWVLARQLGVRPDCVIGDFDSSDVPENENVLCVPVEKDDADTMLCLKKGLAMGYESFLIVGGFGGRVDHTLANFQLLHYAAVRGARAEMCDGNSWATALCGEGRRVPANVVGDGTRPVKLSVFALTDACRGVDIRGAKWTLEDAALTNGFPLGLSNAFATDSAEIAVREGVLLVTVCVE